MFVILMILINAAFKKYKPNDKDGCRILVKDVNFAKNDCLYSNGLFPPYGLVSSISYKLACAYS